jgi:nicotinamide phosphoribosyltransferase
MKILTANLTDGYKCDHRSQYPKGTNLIYGNFTARKSRFPEINYTVLFGLQGVAQKHLINDWNNNFFNVQKNVAVEVYKRRIDSYLGKDSITYDHIGDLHDLGYLPIKIKAVKEGTKVPINIPSLTIYNTKPEFFWLTNYLETILSCMLWKPITSATLANRYKRVFDEYAMKTVGNTDFTPFQGHDFSFRGMSGLEDACSSGGAHLTSFVGTDTIPAIDWLEEYYGADSDNELIGCSVPATEHSVMSMGGVDDEIGTFRGLLELYPKGIVSVVSDTWDFWKVVTEYLPTLKPEILARDGKLVIRPDSGDPVKICCGDPEAETEWERKGDIECLWDTFGGTLNEVERESFGGIITEQYKQLDSHIGLIYGDSITLERQEQILSKLMAKGFSSTNMVFGIGSYTYQYQTRDSFGMAMKATYGEVNGVGRNIFKDPATDKDKMKKSHKGLLRLNEDMTLDQEVSWDEEAGGIYETVFEDGKLVRFQTLCEIRELLCSQ